MSRLRETFQTLFQVDTPQFGRRLLWLTLVICFYLSFDIELGYSDLSKDETVSILGYLLPLGSASEPTLLVLRVLFVISATLWLAHKQSPWCCWVSVMSFTSLVSIYWENLPWFRHKFILPNLLLIVLALWYQFYGKRIRLSAEPKSSMVEPRWVRFLSLWSVCMFYGLSGISKLRGGWTLGDGTSLQLWFFLLVPEGNLLREAVIESAPLAAFLQSGALVVELSCFTAIIAASYRLPLAVLLTTFHLTVQATMEIPFLTNIPLIWLILGFRDCGEKSSTLRSPSEARPQDL